MQLLNEAVTMDKIPHFDSMSYSHIKKLFSTSNWSLTQKIDGFNVSFGISEGNIFIKPKTGKPFTDLNELKILSKRLSYFKPFVNFYEALERNNFKEIYMKLTEKEDLAFFAELLGSKRQNVVLYNESEVGLGTSVIFAIKQDDGTSKGKDITFTDKGLKLINSFCIKMQEAKSDWNFTMAKPIIYDSNNSTVKNIQNFIKENDKILCSKKRDAKSKLEKKIKFNELQNLIIKFKTNLLEHISKETPFLGADKLEGAVIRNKDNGVFSKIVDREYFTSLNKSSWYGRTTMSELNKKYISFIENTILKGCDILWENKIISLLNEKLSLSENMKYKSIKDIYKILQEEFLSENKPDENAREKLISESKNFYTKIKALMEEVKSNQISEKAIDQDNYKRTINYLIDEVKSMNHLITNLQEDMYGKCIWFCLHEKLKAKLRNRFL